jgi:hypothetical protein
VKNPTKDVFSEKTDRLADHLKLPIKELAAYIGISPDSLSGYRSGRYEISAKAWRKLRTAEMKAGITGIGLNPSESARLVTENEAPYFPRNTGPETGNARTSSPVKINPAFAPPGPHPTEQDCLNHLSAYLAEARHVPGLVAHTLIELKKHFKVADAKAQRED